MIALQENVDLTSLNTFGLKATARYFVSVQHLSQLKALLELKKLVQGEKLVLGGGSNILFTKKYFDGLLIKNEIVGIEKISENDDFICIKVGAGVLWHTLVLYCIENNFGGVENLSLIPGSVGASPIQNIGAYGVEVKDTIESVSAFDFSTGDFCVFSNSDCRFGYRDSLFKQEGKNRYCITDVTFKLTKRNHVYRTDYGAIQEVLTKMKINELSLGAVSNAVVSIRQSKLPDPALIGNAGSFFKNPTVTTEAYKILKDTHHNMPSYAIDNGHVKIPAAWLIEQCGWKGKTFDAIGVHAQQALVIVNYGGGDGDKIFQLAQQIQQSVQEKFNIMLHMEVNII